MHVAKYWRNKQLRYRMIRLMERSANERAPADAKQRGGSRIQASRGKRVKVAS